MLLGGWVGLTEGPAGTKLSVDFIVRIYWFIDVLMSLSFMWLCTVDAKLLGKPLVLLARIGILLSWPVGVPLYLHWARGMRGITHLLLHGVLLLLVTVISMVAGAILYFLYTG